MLAFRQAISHIIFMPIARVLIPLPLPRPYDYHVPDNIKLAAGDFVCVPLGPRRQAGVVWAMRQDDKATETVAPANKPKRKLKAIIEKYDAPPLSTELRDFVDWVAAYIMAPPGLVLAQLMRVPAALAPNKPRLAYRATGKTPTPMTAARQRVLQVLAETGALTSADLCRQAGVSASVVKALLKIGALETYELPDVMPASNIKHSAPKLSDEQTSAATILRSAVGANVFAVHVLDGVTGSGKTEVYFEAIAAALQAGRTSLILLPEISLTAQFLQRFEARFGFAPAMWHSGLSAGERRRTWRAVATNKMPVLMGARSALFLPCHNLGLIVVDEEHDGGYKQEDGMIYNARDMAVVRARLAKCPIVLSTATPSLETFVNMRDGRYQRHPLKARYGGAQLPDIALIDMRATPPPKGKWLVPQMVEAVGAAVQRGEQALLFLNRRGYAPLTLCRACGYHYACPNCDAWLVEHRARAQLQCHHCGLSIALPQHCAGCDEVGQLVACGPGIERVTEEIAEYFPQARLAVLSSDHASIDGAVIGGGAAALRALIQRLADGEADIIIGTQIIAKGHHFPKLSMVGVVDADLGLGNGDLRASETTYQMLLQVAGRAGRDKIAGRVMLQSHMPEHAVLQALKAGDRDRFLHSEADARQQAAMPPFGRLAALIVSAPDFALANNFVQALARKIPTQKGVRVLGPAPAPIARLRDRYRFRFLIKAEKSANQTALVQNFIKNWLADTKLRGGLRLQIDIDPYSFM